MCHSHLNTHVSPTNAALFFNKPAENQGQGVQDLVFLYREKTNEIQNVKDQHGI